jgi:hypothetical protein
MTNTEPNRLTIVVNVKRPSDLRAAAGDVADFIGTVRDQTGDEYTVDITVGVSAEPEKSAKLTEAIGYVTERPESSEEEDE